MWLDTRPADIKLEIVVPQTEGLNLPAVRGRLKQLQDELRILEAAPIPPPDLAAYVDASVRGVASTVRLVVDYVGAGQELRWSLEGDHGAKFAFLFPERLSALLADKINAICSQPLPVAERGKRISALRAEIDVMQRICAALVNAAVADGRDETHDPATPPPAVLGVTELAPLAPSQLQLSA